MVEKLGWYAFIASVVFLSVYASKSLLRFVMDKGTADEQVYLADAWLHAVIGVGSIVLKSLVASVSAAAILAAILFSTSASIPVAIGYACIAYCIGKLITLRQHSQEFPVTSSAVTADTVDSFSIAPVVNSPARSTSQSNAQMNLFV